MNDEKLVHIQVRVPESMRTDFRQIAEKNQHNASALIRSWIEQYIKENQNKI